MPKTAAEKAARSAQHRQELIDAGYLDPNGRGEDCLSMLDLESNDREYLITLTSIQRAMERGVELTATKRQYGIPRAPLLRRHPATRRPHP